MTPHNSRNMFAFFVLVPTARPPASMTGETRMAPILPRAVPRPRRREAERDRRWWRQGATHALLFCLVFFIQFYYEGVQFCNFSRLLRIRTPFEMAEATERTDRPNGPTDQPTNTRVHDNFTYPCCASF